MTSSSGGLAGATGFLMMVDTPVRGGPALKTHYEGDINIPGIGRPVARKGASGC